MAYTNASWRDVLPVHPAADLFLLMSEVELIELGEDIKKNGLRVKPLAWQDPQGKVWLVDGRSRLAALEAVGLHPSIVNEPLCPGSIINVWRIREPAINLDVIFHVEKPEDKDPCELALSLNLHRRHLTVEQRRELIAKVLRATPDKSNRQIAEAVKASHVTVGAVRTELEGRGQIDHVEAHTDTKGRKQRAHKRSTSGSAVVTAVGIAPASAQMQPMRDGASDQAPRAPQQNDPDDLIARFTAEVQSGALELMKQIPAACRPRLIERLREVVEEMDLEAERWTKEVGGAEEPDIRHPQQRSAP
jgi:hypothetical protein